MIFNSPRGFTLVLVILVLLVTGLLFFSLSNFSNTENKLMKKVIESKKLEYLALSGINIAEDLLQKSRWYGEKYLEGKHEVTNLKEQDSKLTIYAQDFPKSAKYKLKIGQYEYFMLDHIKVFVKAVYKGKTMYGFGKYIISPEPTVFGKSTVGINPDDTTKKADITFRKMINVGIMSSSEAVTKIAGFKNIDDWASRMKFADYMKKNLDKYVINWSKNKQMSQNIKSISKTQPTYSNAEMDIKLTKLRTNISVTNNINKLRNTFISENASNFFMSTNWNIKESEKYSSLSNVEVKIGPLPQKTKDPFSKKAIEIVFGAGNPKIPVFKNKFDFNKSNGASSISELLEYKNYKNFIDKDSIDFINNTTRIISGYAYAFTWKSVEVVTLPAGGVKTIINGVGYGNNSCEAFVYYYNTNCSNTTFNKISGPEPIYTNYYLKNNQTNKEIPVASIMNFFLKYVSEEHCMNPNQFSNNSQKWKIWLAPGPPTTGIGKVKTTF